MTNFHNLQILKVIEGIITSFTGFSGLIGIFNFKSQIIDKKVVNEKNLIKKIKYQDTINTI